MIHDFRKRVLDSLDRLYGIVGSIARVSAIDIAPPVLVHDVSREAEAANGFYQPAPVTIGPTGGAGVTIFASLTRESWLTTNGEVIEQLNIRGLTASEVDVWIMGCSGIMTAASAGNLARLDLAVNHGLLTGTGVTRQLESFNVEGNPVVNGASIMLQTNLGAAAFGKVTFPYLWPDDNNSQLLATLTDDAGGAVTATGYWWCWVGPKGTFPPLA